MLETTITARELGRAYAACSRRCSEDQAFSSARMSLWSMHGHVDSKVESEFRAGFREMAP
jgi:hypothetical protein